MLYLSLHCPSRTMGIYKNSRNNICVDNCPWRRVLFNRDLSYKKCPHIVYSLLRVYWPRGYKTLFMLNSVEHEILDAHKYKNIKKIGFFRLR